MREGEYAVGGDPEWFKGPGLYVELGPAEAHLMGLLGPSKSGAPEPSEPRVLFEPLPDGVFNVEKWVYDTLGEWGYPAPPAEQVTELVKHLKGEQSRPPSTMKRVKFDPSRARPPEWLWDERMYLGGFNILLGREGVGKGTLMSWIISQLALGRLPGKFHGTPTNVAIIGTEDSVQNVWTPRIIAAMLESGVSLTEAERLVESHVVEYKTPEGSVPRLEDAPNIAAAMQEDEIKLIFFDSLLDNLDDFTDVYRDKSVRDTLSKAKWLAEEMEAAVVGSLHPNKSGATFDRIVSGARAFNAVSRCSLILGDHPEDESVRVLVRGKGNYSEEPQPLEFELVGTRFELNGREFPMPVARDVKASSVSLDDLMKRFAGEGAESKEPTKVEQATEVLEELLADGKPHGSLGITAALAERDLAATNTVQNAKKRANVKSFQKGGEWWVQKDVTIDTE
jgi:AAA domain-containing protein